jgi:hypothetical protein
LRHKIKIWEFFDKKIFKLKISTCYSSPIFCANVLLHGTSFDYRSSLAGNMALTIGIPSGVEKQVLFFRFIAYTKPKRGKKKKKTFRQNIAIICTATCQAHKRCWV